MSHFSRSQLFLTELVAAVVLFSLCMAVCAGVFLRAKSASRASENLTQAIYVAEDTAERLCSGLSPEALCAGGRGEAEADRLSLGYTADWQPCPPTDAFFLLEVRFSRAGSLRSMDITVSALSAEKTLYHLESSYCTAEGGGAA